MNVFQKLRYFTGRIDLFFYLEEDRVLVKAVDRDVLCAMCHDLHDCHLFLIRYDASQLISGKTCVLPSNLRPQPLP